MMVMKVANFCVKEYQDTFLKKDVFTCFLFNRFSYLKISQQMAVAHTSRAHLEHEGRFSTRDAEEGEGLSDHLTGHSSTERSSSAVQRRYST